MKTAEDWLDEFGMNPIDVSGVSSDDIRAALRVRWREQIVKVQRDAWWEGVDNELNNHRNEELAFPGEQDAAVTSRGGVS